MDNKVETILPCFLISENSCLRQYHSANRRKLGLGDGWEEVGVRIVERMSSQAAVRTQSVLSDFGP